MKSAKRARAIAKVLELQSLEVRRLLANASITGGDTLTITGTNNAETIEVKKNSSNQVTVTGDSDLFPIGSFTKIVINAMGGSDTIKIDGTVGSSKASTINAGDGNDYIRTGHGDDVIFGQNGFDTVDYSARTGSVTVRLDGLQNDGEAAVGETDNVNAEEVLGGAGNDVFVGNDSANFFGGGAGADEMAAAGGSDELVGSTGQDALFGESGDDSLFAKNSDIDTVNGGVGNDLAEVDGIDSASSVAAQSALRASLVAAATAAASDPSALDVSYGGNDTGLNSGPDFNWSQVTAATVDSQGRVILVGYDFRDEGTETFGSDFVATRYNADGTHDTTFGGAGGEVVVNFDDNIGDGYADDDFAWGVTTDADDNIIIVGSSSDEAAFGSDDFAVCRLDDTGALDTVFGTRRYDIVSEDTTIGGNGQDAAHDAVVQADGLIVVVGTSNKDIEFGGGDVAIIRLDDLGDLDAGFNEGTGMNTLDVGNDEGVAVAIQTSGESTLGIVVGGNSDGSFLLARFTLLGELDTTFGEATGYTLFNVSETSSDTLNDIGVNPTDGDIVAVGQSTDIILTFASDPIPGSGAVGVLAGFQDDGTLDGPATYGVVDNEVSFNAVAYDPTTGGLAVVGSTGEDFVFAKFSNISEFAPGFDSLVVTDFTPGEDSEWYDVALGIGVLEDGKVVVGGYSDTCGDGCIQTSVARYGGAEEGPVEEVEEFITFDDVADLPSGHRSALATFYLNSTHLDDEGRATIELTNNNDTVTITKVVAEDGSDQAAVTVGDVTLYYDMDTTSITINCKNGNDVVTCTDDVTIPLIINGGNGNDQLQGGGGDDVINGGSGNDTVSGGAGDDILLGESGLDTVNGNDGNDILIGGSASDVLNGGGGEDILIGGTTSHDNDLEALQALSAEWSGAGSFNDRIASLSSGAGPNLIANTTVFNDNALDTYTGGADSDWFFRKNTGGTNTRDVITDLTGADFVTAL